MFRESHGRVINNVSEYYVRPADDAEYARGEIQHDLLRETLGGLFVRPDLVNAALAPKPNLQQTIIDIGTGAGTWACEMGRAFPDALVVGLDLVPASFKQQPPSNCRFECDDVNWGLPHYKNTFDVVHARFVCTGLKNYYGLLEDAANMLRPGGIFLSLEGDMQLYDENRQEITAQNPGEPGFSWVQKFFWTAVSFIKDHVGTGTGAAKFIPTWLQVQGFWESSGEEIYMVPVGPWEAHMTERDIFVANSMRQNFLLLLDSYRPLFLDHDVSESEWNELLANVRDELLNKNKKIYARFHACWAVRKS